MNHRHLKLTGLALALSSFSVIASANTQDATLDASDPDLIILTDPVASTDATSSEPASSNDSAITTETVVVTAARTEQKLLDANASVSVVEHQQILKSAKDNIPELLRRETGVNLTSDGTPGVKRISIRGESASRTLVMIDGQRLDDQKTKSGVPFLVNPYFVERIEVLKGPSSVLYGSDALGGIVNIITKQASEKPFEFEGGLSFNGSNNGFTEFANVSGTLDKFSYALGAFNSNNSDVFLASRERVENTSYNVHGFNSDLSYKFSSNFKLGYAFDYVDTDAETATTIDHPTFKYFLGNMPKWERQKHKLYFKLTDVNDYVAAVDGSIYYQKNDKIFNSRPQLGLNVGVVNEQDSIGGNLQAEFSLFDMFYLVTGYDMRIDSMDSTSDIGIAMGPVRGNININDADYKQHSHALYALLSTYLTDELTLNTGLRYNYVKTEAGTSALNGRMQVPGQNIPIKMLTNAEDSSDSQLVGSLGLVYRPFDHGAFRFNFSQGFRVPNIQELYLITSTGTLQYGNPNLEPEKSDNYEVGFRWGDNALSADIAAFYTYSRDYIETYGNGSAYTYRNIANVKSYGIEGAVSYNFGKFEPYAKLTLMERKYETESGSSTNTGTPKLTGNAGMRYFANAFELDAYANFASSTRNDNLDGTSYFDDVYYGGYVTYNLSISTSFGPNDSFTAFASLENILDKRYQTNELIHEPGRFVSLGLQGRF